MKIVLIILLIGIIIQNNNCNQNKVQHKKSKLRKLSKKNKQIYLEQLNDFFNQQQNFELKPSNNKDKKILVREYNSPHVAPSSIIKGGTPNARKLSNVYGLEPLDNPYGPQPKLLFTTTYLGNQGFVQQQIQQLKNQNMTFDQIQKYLDRVLADRKSGLFKKTYDSKLIHQNVQCDIKEVKGYELCFQLSSCEVCTSAVGCGWCDLSSQCLPGNLTHAACSSSCQNKWLFRTELCPSNHQSISIQGKIYGTSSFNLTTPEIAEPKLKVNSIISYPAVVHTPVVLGDKLFYTRKEVKMPNGEKTTTQKYRKEPIYGTLHQVIDIDVPHSQFINVQTGKHVDEIKDQPKVSHGYDVEELQAV